MSQHVIVQGPVKVEDRWEDRKWVFGWDQPLQSFYLQKHVAHAEEDANPILWLGATADTRMYEVEDLVREAMRHDLDIPYRIQVELHQDKDDGR